MRSTPKTKALVSKIARERIETLFMLARSAIADGDIALSRKYISYAVKIREHYNIRLGAQKYLFCKKCKTLLVPGITSSTRLVSSNNIILVKCLNCGAEMRKVYKKKARI